jgi:predicted nicotinamide N-methyase
MPPRRTRPIARGPDRRAFVLRHARLRPVPGLPPALDLRLHLADEVLPLWRAVGEELGDDDPPLPYWAFAWGGGLALVAHLAGHPEAVAGRRIADLAAGSGLCGLAALRCGASAATALEIDPFAVEAIGLNARANGLRLRVVGRDLLDGAPPEVDVILAGDWAYEAELAARVLGFLRRAAAAGIEVLVGDPGRAHLPTESLEPLAVYEVRTSTELEDADRKTGTVYRLRSPGPTSPNR